MRVFCGVFLCLAGLVAARSVFADEETVDRLRPQAPLSEADEKRFQSLVKEGAQAAADGRIKDAVKAYHVALDLRFDALVGGRLGLLLAMYEHPSIQVTAATYLYKAISEHIGTTREERKAFFDAFDSVQTKICRIDITTNEVSAFVQLDEHPPVKSYGAYWEFAEPGKHEIVATLEGRESVRKTLDCPKGKKVEVSLNFPRPEVPIKTFEKTREKVVFVDAPSPMANADKPSSEQPPKKGRANVAAGPSMVFGAAPSPALGISLSATYDLGKFLVTAGTRGAYAVAPFPNAPIDIFSFSGLAGPCKRWSWFNACGFASVNVIKPVTGGSIPSDAYTTAKVVPGFGFGIGGRHVFSNGLSVYATGDATFLTERSNVLLSKANRTSVLWEGSPFLASMSLGVEFAP